MDSTSQLSGGSHVMWVGLIGANAGRARVSGALLLLGVAVSLGGCASTQQERAARFSKKAQALQARKDYSRATIELRNAIKLTPSDAELYYQLAHLRLETGDGAEAYPLLQRAVELNPRHAGAQRDLAALMVTSNDLGLVAEGESRLKELTDNPSAAPGVFDSLALAEARLGKPEEAVRRLQEALERFPAHLQSSVTLARLRVQEKDFAGAEAVLRKAVGSGPQTAAAAVALGQLYVVEARTVEAEAEFRRALRIEPNNASALLSLGELLVAAGRMPAAEQTYKDLAALPDKAYRPLYAILLLQENKSDLAIAEFARLSREAPDDRAARSRLVAALLQAARTLQAEAILGKALKDNPKDVDALLQRSQIAVRARRFAEAERDLTEVLHFRPDSTEAHAELAQIYQARGLRYNERRELEETLRLNPQALPVRLRLAHTLLAADAQAEALDLLEKTPENQQNRFDVVVETNWILLAVGRADHFRKGVERGLTLGRYPELVLQQSIAEMHSREFAAARAHALEVLQAEPRNIRAARLVADSYAIQSQPEAALAAIREIVAHHPESVALQAFLGDWLVSVGKHAEARQVLQAALATDANFVPARISLAGLDIAEHNLEGARAVLAPAIQSQSPDVGALLLSAQVEKHSGNLRGAVADYRTVLQVNQSNLEALNNLAVALVELNPQEALGIAQRAAELAPDNPAVRDTLGWALYAKGMYPTAVPHLRFAVDKEPTPIRQFHLALCYLKIGDTARGNSFLRMAVAKDPGLAAGAR